MRMAQARARNERFDLQLPPLESMHAVQSALSQIMETVAADMLDLKRADRLIRLLTVASRNLLKADKWPAAPVFHSEHAADVDVAAEYGLPQDLDLDTPRDVAFPPPSEIQSVILSGGGAPSAPPQSKSRCFAGVGAGSRDPERAERVEGDPFVSADANGDNIQFSPTFPISPENVEVCEIYETQGPDAAQVRCDQLERNRSRRQLRTDRKRYADIALRRNIRIAAENLADRRAQEKLAAKKPPASVATDAAAAIPENTELSRTGSNG